MKKLFYIMGKSSGGKDTFYKELLNRFDLAPVVLYTTRPIRENETDGLEYHFTDRAGFDKMKAAGDVIEERIYNTAHGEWIYFTAADSIPEGDFCLGIGTLESYVKIRERFGEAVVPLYIEVEDGIRLTRALEREKQQREPKYKEMCRRFIADCDDFSEEKISAAGIVKKFTNNGTFKECMAQLTEYIKRELERE